MPTYGKSEVSGGRKFVIPGEPSCETRDPEAQIGYSNYVFYGSRLIVPKARLRHDEIAHARFLWPG